MTALSQHFFLHEFLRSESAARAGLELKPEPVVVDNLRRLCVDVLEPLRVAIGAPITVLSGYRPEWLNRMVGGSKTSEHMQGRAADIIAAGYTVPQLCAKVRDMGLPYNQLIEEFGRWCHVSVPIAGLAPLHKVLTARSVQGVTRYTEGLAA